MKTAISIPDELFTRAERFARRTKRSRSKLFSDAVKDYMARHATDEFTERMDKLIAELGQPADPAITSAAHRTLRRTEW
jgi:metal-responsive CopG/Arc/MetJ family transcriptional regulator